jgi:hypothetical protein
LQAGDYGDRLLSAGMRASGFDIRNEKKRPFDFARANIGPRWQ